MVALKFHKMLYATTCCFLVGTGCSAENIVEDSNILIDNSIEECIHIKPINKLFHENVILLDTELSTIKSVGYCGCKSAVLSYFITTHPVESSNQTKEYGIFTSLRHGVYTFVLDRNDTPNKNKSYTLNIQCASPD